MKAFITIYALSNGIMEVSYTQHESTPNMIEYHFPTNAGWTRYALGEGKQWHRTIESARSRAEEMRLKKIKSLKKSIARLESLKF